MKSRLGTAAMAATAVAALASGAAAEEKLQKLSAGQIRAKIAGMELTDEVHWRELYGRSGTVTSDSMGTSEPENGGSNRISFASGSLATARNFPPTLCDLSAGRT